MEPYIANKLSQQRTRKLITIRVFWAVRWGFLGLGLDQAFTVVSAERRRALITRVCIHFITNWNLQLTNFQLIWNLLSIESARSKFLLETVNHRCKLTFKWFPPFAANIKMGSKRLSSFWSVNSPKYNNVKLGGKIHPDRRPGPHFSPPYRKQQFNSVNVTYFRTCARQPYHVNETYHSSQFTIPAFNAGRPTDATVTI